MSELKKKPLFNPGGDTDIRLRRMIGGNTTNLNDFNNLRYTCLIYNIGYGCLCKTFIRKQFIRRLKQCILLSFLIGFYLSHFHSPWYFLTFAVSLQLHP